jgi:hypothetical protein
VEAIGAPAYAGHSGFDRDRCGSVTLHPSDYGVDFHAGLVERYPIVSIEDGWEKTIGRLGEADGGAGPRTTDRRDLFAINPERAGKASAAGRQRCW